MDGAEAAMLLGLVACVAEEVDTPLVEQVARDLADLAADVETAAVAATLSAGPPGASCTPGPVQSCEWCVQADGGPLGGTFAIAEAACERAACTVDERALIGTYDGYVAGAYLLEAEGWRVATVDVEDADPVDVSYTIEGIVATTLGHDLAWMELALAYDAGWVLDASGAADAVEGELVADGVRCSLSGSWEEVAIECP